VSVGLHVQPLLNMLVPLHLLPATLCSLAGCGMRFLDVHLRQVEVDI
jgi:hypothetical protein